MRILIVGGTGLISSELAHLAVAAGDDVTLINRGRSTTAPAAPGAHVIHVDASDAAALRSALQGARLRRERFDAVIQFVAFDADQVRADVETFANLTDRYVLIATAASYKTFHRHTALTEDTPQENLFWEYARLKAAAELALRDHADRAGLAWTIVRPAHTYGPSKIPAFTGNSKHPWTIVDRMRRGADIVIPGDGTAVWTITHARDVAAGIHGLLANPAAVGESVHITSDEALTWTSLYGAIARAAGLSAEQFAAQSVFVPSEAMIAAAPHQEGSIRGDKMHNAVFNTTKIKALVPQWQASIPFSDGVRECVAWFEADPDRQSIDADANMMFDSLAAIYKDALARSRELS